MDNQLIEKAWKALDRLRIELPSWGFANTGTRFGKFVQPAAANTIAEKFSDAAQVRLHRHAEPGLHGSCAILGGASKSGCPTPPRAL